MKILSSLCILLLISTFMYTSSYSDDINIEKILVTSEEHNGIFSIEFLNNNTDNFDINAIQIWVDEKKGLKSFKAEKGWAGKRISENTIIFTSMNPLNTGNSAKFIVKTEHVQNINWKIINYEDGQKVIGKINLTKNTDFKDEKVLESHKLNPEFRIEPLEYDNKNTIRIIGENFNKNQTYYLYINDYKIRSFEVDNKGNFIIKADLPVMESNDTINVAINNDYDFKMNKNFKILHPNIKQEKDMLTLDKILNNIDINSTLELEGKSNPDDNITVYIRNPSLMLITKSTTYTDSNGKWYEQITIPKDSETGEWVIEITNGKKIINKEFTVKSLQQTIELNSTKSIYKHGEIISLNCKAAPNKELKIIIEDSQGSEIFSDSIHIDDSGTTHLEIPTRDVFLNDTYSIFASQGSNTNMIMIGVGETPKEKIAAKMDKVNYEIDSTAIIDFYGPKYSMLSLIIIDPYDENKFSDSVMLETNGHARYVLDLHEYIPGTYTLVATRGNSQTSENFSIGLLSGSGHIELHTTKNKYKPGESILVLGNANKNVQIHLSMLDHNGNKIKTQATFTDKHGVFYDSTFRIPLNSNSEELIIEARSGSNYTDKKISIINTQESFLVNLDNIKYSINEIMTINGYNPSGSTTILLKITDQYNNAIDQLEIFSTKDGKFLTMWKIPQHVSSGIYFVEASNNVHKTKTTFTIE